MKVAFLSERSKTLLFEHKIGFINKKNLKTNFIFCMFFEKTKISNSRGLSLNSTKNFKKLKM